MPVTEHPRPAVRFTRRCAFCRASSARRCSRSTAFAGRSTTSRIPMVRGPNGWPRFSNGATISTRCIRAIRRRGCGTTSRRFGRFDLKREDFLAIVDGMEMDVPQDIRAPDLATLDLYCDRVASAVGRLSVRVFGLAAGRRHPARASSWPRAAIDQYPARYRRRRRDRPAVPAARRAAARGHHQYRSAQGHRRPGAAESMRAAGRSGRGRISRRPTKSWRRNPRRVVRAPRIMSKYYRAILELLVARGFAAPRTPVRLNKLGPHRHSSSLRIDLMQKTVHIIGAGISGLSAAVRLANAEFQGACPRGHATGRRPLPVLFRCGDQPHHR